MDEKEVILYGQLLNKLILEHPFLSGFMTEQYQNYLSNLVAGFQHYGHKLQAHEIRLPPSEEMIEKYI